MALRFNLVAAVSTLVVFYSSSLLASQHASTVMTSSPSLSQPAKAEVSSELKVRERYEYYDIDGADVCDLQQQIKHNGTKWNDGETYAAVTSWDLKYSYDIANDDGKCSVKSVKTDVEIVYHLPRRVCLTSPPEVTRLWDEYMVNLRHHEFGHKDLTVRIAGELNATLSSLQGFGSQAELEQEAKRRTDEKLQQLKEEQIEYDEETGHGETQGAVLAAR